MPSSRSVRKIRTAISPRLATSTFEKPATTGILCRYGAGRSADGRTHGGGARDRGPFAIDFGGHEYWATALFAIAMATDWVDGWLARRSGSSSAMGSLLDPVADKILVLSVLIVLLGEGIFAGWIVAAIVAREFLVSGLRLAALERGVVLGARDLGKLKTGTQSIAAILGGFAAAGAIDESIAWWALARRARRDLGVRARLRPARPTASPQPRLGRRSRSATRR